MVASRIRLRGLVPLFAGGFLQVAIGGALKKEITCKYKRRNTLLVFYHSDLFTWDDPIYILSPI